MYKMPASEIHNLGFNCAQSVLVSLSDLTRLDEKAAFAVASGFGGGVRAGEICGAVSGAVMALGIVFPFDREGDMQAKERIAIIVKDFHARFLKTHPCMTCRGLLGCDINSPEGMQTVLEKGLSISVCSEAMDCAEKIAREVIAEYKDRDMNKKI